MLHRANGRKGYDWIKPLDQEDQMGLTDEQYTLVNTSFLDADRIRAFHVLVSVPIAQTLGQYRAFSPDALSLITQLIVSYLPAPVRTTPTRNSARSSGFLMLFPSSGRRGFQSILPRFALKADKEILLGMLRRERELRLSNEIQNEFDMLVIRDERDALSELCERIQIQVVTEFGFDIEEGLNYLRSAAARYPNDSEISNIAYYIKYNRSEQGPLQCGDVISDAELWTVDQQRVSFGRLLSEHMQTFI